MKIGIIGVGHWGINYVRNFLTIPDVKVIGVADVNKKRINKYKNSIKITTVHYKDLIKNKEIDSLVISTPASHHFKIAEEAILNNKHILIEKPLTTKLSDALKLKKILEKKRNLVFMVGHTFLFNPAIQKIKSILSRVGSIYYVIAARTHLGLIREDVNVIWDLLPHDISILNYLLEELPTDIVGIGADHLKNGRNDIAFVNLIYKNKTIANLMASWEDCHKERKIQIIGSKAKIIFDDLNHEAPVKIIKKGVSAKANIETDNWGSFKYVFRDGDIISPKISIKEPLHQVCRHFVDCIKNRIKPKSDIDNGIDVIKVLDAIEKSLKNHRQVGLL